MSADYFLVSIEPGPPRGQQAVRDFLAPHMRADDVHIEWGDDGSEVDIHGLERDFELLTLNRPAGHQIWNLVYELMLVGNLMFTPSDGNPVMVLDDATRDAALKLSPESNIVVVSSGDDIREALG
jgi:hypothetical protein